MEIPVCCLLPKILNTFDGRWSPSVIHKSLKCTLRSYRQRLYRQQSKLRSRRSNESVAAQFIFPFRFVEISLIGISARSAPNAEWSWASGARVRPGARPARVELCYLARLGFG
ncbi:hypothetical protein EVAR_62492_1 [Eumeta japonica]|uniref:Uncharacterized protein n=1 Tax=Eumeta variegata TaxID=151549 RepID=A0A4C1ZN65_EUMVA|nr:hypothetical protein EVAR_62492_1 [Eumeta japonica]